ncbi:aldo/keto reductase [bacterium]|nr:aldo/keto reductase [bacterium]
MKYRKLQSTDLEVSEISLGCWPMGGQNWDSKNGLPIGWDNIKESDIKEAIDYAVEHGVNHFDNADVYGNGRAERLLAKCLGDKSKDMVIASKAGHFTGTAEYAYEPLHIRHQCEQSLINLNRDYIDIYYFHHGNFGADDFLLNDALSMMHKLRDEGKIRYIGLSAYSTADFKRLIPVIKPSVIQSWANVLDDKFIKDGCEVRAFLDKYNISFIAFSPLAQGLLLDKYSSKKLPEFKPGDHRKNSQKFTKEYIEKVEKGLEKIKKRFGEKPEDLARVALQYVLSVDRVGCVIPGFRNKKQVECNLKACSRELSF